MFRSSLIGMIVFFSFGMVSGAVEVTVDCSESPGKLPKFWAGTGFTPASGLLDPGLKQMYAIIGSVPNGGLAYTRPHDLLKLVGMTGQGTADVAYDWTRLDEVLDAIVGSNCKLIFEIMGFPNGSSFTDFAQSDQVRAWRDLVEAMARRYRDRYGIGEISTWYFETWNEPDTDWWPQPNLWSDGARHFLNYYDACRAGLDAVEPSLKLGGPGVAHEEPLPLLAHCAAGTNFFTGKTGTRIDFVSVHWKDDVNRQISRETTTINLIRQQFPVFKELRFFNDEADRYIGWRKERWPWRPLPHYPAYVCNQVNQHVVRMVDGMGVNYGIMSNDNSFWGNWLHRTLFACFGSSDEFALIKKPVFNGMVMLSLLGEERCGVEGIADLTEGLGVIATRTDDSQVAILLYYDDIDDTRTLDYTVDLRVTGVPFTEGSYVHYRIDSNHTHPYKLYGSTAGPSEAQLAELRLRQELEYMDPPKEIAVGGGVFAQRVDMPRNSVSLIMLSRKPATAPPQVTNVKATEYRGVSGKPEYLVSWDGVASRFHRTYEVLHSPDRNGPYVRVNTPDVLTTTFLHAGPKAKGFYKVCAVDYWGRRGPLSEVDPYAATVDIVVDNGTDGYREDGTWSTSRSMTGYYGQDYRVAAPSIEVRTARWTPSLPEPGDYEIFIWYPSDQNKNTNVPVTIVHNGGLVTRTVNQTGGGGAWNSLGVFTCSGDTSNHVEISTRGMSDYVVADAARFRSRQSTGRKLSPGPAVRREGRCSSVEVFSLSGRLIRTVVMDRLHTVEAAESLALKGIAHRAAVVLLFRTVDGRTIALGRLSPGVKARLLR